MDDAYSSVMWRYDAEAHQLVAFHAAAEGEGLVEVARLDALWWSQADRQRMRHVRDPEKPLPAQGDKTVTR